MTSPLYSVGQHVAVCTMSLSVVIPATVVRDRMYCDNTEYTCGITGRRSAGFYTGWAYLTDGHPSWAQEQHLRPINPDTEYLTDSAPQKLEQPA